jgi:hypothetical protein
MRRVFIYRSPGDAGEGGGGQGPSLTDIANDLEDGEFGRVEPKPIDLSAAELEAKRIADEAAAAADKGDEPKLDADGNPIEEDLDLDDDPPGDDPKLDENGNPIVDEPGDEDPEEAEAYWAEVGKYAEVEGLKLEKGLDPATTAKNIEIIAEARVAGFEEYLKTSLPDAYRYLVHVQNGGDRESFFNTEPGLPPAEEVIKGDINAAEAMVRTFYKQQKLDDSDIDAIVAQLKTDDKLVTKALTVRKTVEEDIQAKTQEKLDAMTKRQEKLDKAKTGFIKKVDTIVAKGQVGNFVIPEKDRADFAAFFTGRIAPTEDGKFVVSYELNPEELDVELQKEFLRFKKGNLKDIIVREAKTLNTKQLRLRVGADNPAGKNKRSGGGGAPLPLSDVFGQ